jgi:hypothetical protein
MSDSELDSSELHTFTQALKSLEENLSETIQDLHHLKKKVHTAEHTHQDLYKHTGLQDFLHKGLPIWKKEGRLSTSGFLVHLTQEEKSLLSLTEQDDWISVYKIAMAFLKTNLPNFYSSAICEN